MSSDATPPAARPPLTPARIEAIIHRGLPLARDWGVTVQDAADGSATLRLPVNPALLRPGGTLSGPALMGMADIAFFAAFLTVTGGHDDARTQQLQIVFLRPAGPGPLLAEARIIRSGRSVVYGEVWLRAEGSDKPCGHVTSTWLKLAG
jgi:uncharacterized protein (TIGR00369 family)